jgi:TIR domain
MLGDKMQVFISHNKDDKETARVLAISLVEQGVSVWFDEWTLRPGDSIIGGIEKGLQDSDIFTLLWSKSASKSNWVGEEIKAYIHRRIKENSLKIVPIMLDNTPLPILVADYKGFSYSPQMEMSDIASQITGKSSDREIAKILQNRLIELTYHNAIGGDPLPYLVCPTCGSEKLLRFEDWDKRGDHYFCIKCEECNWYDYTE